MKRKIIKNIVFAFCEWETEEIYLQCFWKISKVKIYTHKIWEINITNTKRQIGIIQNCLKNKYGINNTSIKSGKIKVFYLADIDTIKEIKDIDTIKKQCKQEWIEILFSNQNFELFILEHYQYYTKEKTNYIDEIKKYVPEYKKWRSLTTKRIFEWIIENNLDILKQNIKKLKDFHESNGRSHVYDMNPYSEIINLIEYVLRFSENS